MLGEVGPLSPPGGYADGQLMKDAAILATDEINKAGGVLGRPVAVSYQDTRGLPEEGTAAAERLTAQEHVAAIFGEFHSSVFLAEMEVVHKTGTPILAVDVWANKITAKVASDHEKPNGLTIVPSGDEARFLAPLSVRKLWGIGPVAEEKLFRIEL